MEVGILVGWDRCVRQGNDGPTVCYKFAYLCPLELFAWFIYIPTVLNRRIFSCFQFSPGCPTRIHFSGGGIELIQHGLQALAGGEGLAVLRVGGNEGFRERCILHVEQLT